MAENNTVLEALRTSNLYQDYERAFSEATGLPVALRPVESWQLPHHRQRTENPFCAMMAAKSRACAACLQVQQKLAEEARIEPKTVTCAVGLSDTAVPVRMGEQLIGFLHTGQVFRRKPTATQFERVTKLLSEWGVEADVQALKDAYFNSRTLSTKEHDGVVTLMSIFAQQLSALSNQILVQRKNAEPPVITRAKEFIKQHLEEDITLGEVAKSVNTSTFYFCKLFKKVTGLNFTDYVSRVRIESAKNLLLNPNLRISEIAYEVGFQSLTHFNRVFKRLVGESPTSFRGKLAKP
jgi:AraC-like DNA-binding protein/ligand-binding sensor protein